MVTVKHVDHYIFEHHFNAVVKKNKTWQAVGAAWLSYPKTSILISFATKNDEWFIF